MIINIEDQDEIRRHIQQIFDKKCSQGPKFSLRAFAGQLDISPGILSQFLNSKKVLSSKTLRKILEKTEVNPEIRKNFLSIYEENLQKKKVEKENSVIISKKIESTSFAKVKEPIFFNYLNFIETTPYKKGLAKHEIAQKLNLSVSDLEYVTETLLSEGLIEVGENQLHFRTAKNFTTDDDIAIDAIKFHNEAALRNAIGAIHNTPVELRDITTLTLPANPANLPKAKELIRKLQDDLIILLNQNPKEEVYHLSIALFPANSKK